MSVRAEPCQACPYRKDVPGGVWSFEDYSKLPPYDGETWEQPPTWFGCHATPEHLCHGWAVVGGYDLAGIRMYMIVKQVEVEIPEPTVPLFATHTEAAMHGMEGINRPSKEARVVMARLKRKYKRLRDNE